MLRTFGVQVGTIRNCLCCSGFIRAPSHCVLTFFKAPASWGELGPNVRTGNQRHMVVYVICIYRYTTCKHVNIIYTYIDIQMYTYICLCVYLFMFIHIVHFLHRLMSCPLRKDNIATLTKLERPDLVERASSCSGLPWKGPKTLDQPMCLSQGWANYTELKLGHPYV